MLRLLERLSPSAPPSLHRWCHRTSPAYAATCDWVKKVDAANADADPAPMASKEDMPSTREEMGEGDKRDCVSVLVVDSYGF